MDGDVVDHRQLKGTIVDADPQKGVELRLGDDRCFWLPAQPDAFEVAEPGAYRLRGSTDVVVDPDFLTTWSVAVDPSAAGAAQPERAPVRGRRPARGG